MQLLTVPPISPCSPLGQAPPDLGAQLDKKHLLFKTTQAKKIQKTQQEPGVISRRKLCVCVLEGKSPWAAAATCPRWHNSCPCSTPGPGGCPRAEPDVLRAEDMRNEARQMLATSRAQEANSLSIHSGQNRKRGLDSVCVGGAVWISSSAWDYQAVGTSTSQHLIFKAFQLELLCRWSWEGFFSCSAASWFISAPQNPLETSSSRYSL